MRILFILFILQVSLSQTTTKHNGCNEKCGKCVELAGHKICLECVGTGHKFTSLFEQTCEGSAISNCLVQRAWAGGNYCRECDDGYALWQLHTKDTSTAGDGSCIAFTDTNAVFGTVSGAAKTAFSITGCKAGFYPKTGPVECKAVADPVVQPTVENCAAYGASIQDYSYCIACNKGLDLITISRETAKTDAMNSGKWFAKYIQQCVPKGDKVQG